nr:hypothetical protein [Tanacetum cinerariifolium]
MSPGNMCHRCTYFLTEKYVGPTVSLGIVVGEGIPCKRSPANIPRRQVAGETYPPRQVAKESRELSVEKRLNVVVNALCLQERYKGKNKKVINWVLMFTNPCYNKCSCGTDAKKPIKTTVALTPTDKLKAITFQHQF